MEKYQTLLGVTYYFTESQNEIPNKVLEKVNKTIKLNFNDEKLICSCWSDSIISKADFFVVVTDKRIISKTPTSLEQNAIKDITGIEQDIYKNIVIKSPGNNSKLFNFNAIPSKKLIVKLLDILNTLWLNKDVIKQEQHSFNIASVSHVASGEDVIGQIEKLSKLRDAGILTDAEFASKKAELLNRI